MPPSLPAPFIDVLGVPNFRGVDTSGKGTLNGNATSSYKPLVFRAADPSRATPEGFTRMRSELNITGVYDLRSSPEIKRDGPEWKDLAADSEDALDSLWAKNDIQRAWVPVFADKDYGPEQVALRYKEYTREGSLGFVAAYRDILKSAGPAYGRIFRHIAKGEACLVHCTAGKDRTGVIVALMLMLVGADEDFICDEYALTDVGLAELKPVFIERLLKNPALEGNRRGVENMVSTKRENMAATLEMIKSEFGGPREYMTKYCNMSGEEIDQLKKNLIAGATNTATVAKGGL